MDNKVQELKDSEARAKAIIDTVADGIITISEKGLIETVNPAVLRMLGYEEAELIGQNVKILMPNPYRDEHDGYLKHFHDTGEKKVIGIGRQVEAQRKDGTVLPIELAVTEMSVAGTKMFTGIIRDISDRIDAQNKQKNAENRNKAILDTVVDGIITINQLGIIETVNPATTKIFGYDASEMIGQNVKMLMPNPYQEEHDGYLQHHRDTGEKKIIGIGREVQGLRKDGSVFPLELAVNDMQVSGEKMFTGIVRDITERKEAEKLKEEFVSTVSHELRTPLTSIRGSIGLLTGGMAGEFNDKAKQLLTIAHNNTERLLMLINDILDLSKIESGKMEFKFKELDVQAFLEQAIESNQGYATQHKATYVLQSSIKGALVLADEHRLMQVMSNLMSNAAKFAPDDGNVLISAARHHKQIRISVTDHGCGIPKELESKIFDKFTQADSSDTRQVGGTGLGLNITKAMVEKHNGRIAFVSELGVGTTFYFDIPELMTKKTPLSEVQKEEGLKSQRILICEDETDIGALLRLILAQAGFDSDVAATAAEAEELLKTHNYVAMTLDIMLPDKNGVDLYKELRRNPATKELPIVFVSAKAQQTKNNEGVALQGNVEWINKPINEEQLVSAIEHGIQCLKSHQYKQILHVEDDEDIRQLVAMLLDEDYVLTQAESLQNAKACLEKSAFDLILLDIGLPDGSGLDLIEFIHKLEHAPEVIIFSADDMKIAKELNVAGSLVKSKTTNEELVQKIKNVVH